MGVRALEVLPGGGVLFFAAGQEAAPPHVLRSRDGLETAAFPVAVHPDAQITIGDDKVLVLRGRDLDAYKTDGGQLFHVELAAGEGSIVAVASGHGETAFVITNRGALSMATPDGLRAVETSERLSDTSYMMRVGGQLIVARGESLWSVALPSGASEEPAEVSEWASGLGSIREFVRDDEGRYVVLNAAREVRRVDPDGTSVLLAGADAPLAADHIAFDADTRTLAIVDVEESRLRAYDYLALTQRDAAPSGRVGAFTVSTSSGSAGLTGAEYWPFVGDAPPNYPADILWGFYPEQGVMFDGEVMGASASEAAVACMERSHAALRTFVQRNASALVEAARVAPLETSSRFYLWVDDYSAASDPFPVEMREAKMWYWQRDPAVPGRIPGYWKWETVLRQDGECVIPDADRASATLQERIRGARE